MKPFNIPASIGFVVILFVASCFKEPGDAEPAQKTNISKGTEVSDVNKAFSLSRNGEVVTVNVKIDISPYKQVQFLKNTTGIPIRRNCVARINSDSTGFEDILPDAKPYWYWMILVPKKGKSQILGPMRIGPDADNIGNYIDIASVYKWSVVRTYTSATIVWSFPNADLKSMEILRKTNINSYAKRNSVFTTLEWSGDTVDTLPDPEADYWYWTEATLVNGRVITQGPIKAEFSSN
jgi:hypothetical protein